MLEFIIKRKIKKLSERKRIPVYKELNKLQSLLILFDTTDSEYADLFLKKLSQMNKAVKGCGCCFNEMKNSDSKDFDFIIIPKQDTDRWGVPSLTFLNRLEEVKYDAIIDLTLNENYTLEYILAYVEAPLKIGFKKNNLPLYDLVITKLPDNSENKLSPIAHLGDMILFYLTQIRSKS